MVVHRDTNQTHALCFGVKTDETHILNNTLTMHTLKNDSRCRQMMCWLVRDTCSAICIPCVTLNIYESMVWKCGSTEIDHSSISHMTHVSPHGICVRMGIYYQVRDPVMMTGLTRFSPGSINHVCPL